MVSRRSVPPSAQAAVSSRGGCLSGFLLPPLAVVSVSLFLTFLLFGSTTTPVPDTLADTQTALPQENLAPLAALFTPEVQWWGSDIQRWAAGTGLDPNLVATVMQIESCGDPRARSRAGAMGLFQVMPYHFYGTDDPYAPDINASRGLAYLKRSLERAGGDIRLALAGYNGGIGVIGRSEFTWAAETQRYVYWGIGIYQDAASGASESLRLQEWLTAGGASLCRQARVRLGIGDQ